MLSNQNFLKNLFFKIIKNNFLYNFFIAFLIALFIRSFIFEPFKIPSSSMKPNLLIGDYLFASKFHYGWSKYHIPFISNLFSNIIKEPILQFNEISRGDIVVFRPVYNDRINYVKRVIGLPGDKIEIKDYNKIYINDQLIEVEYIDKFIDDKSKKEIDRYLQYLDNESSFYFLDKYKFTEYGQGNIYIVPEGHYFMLGDNRDNSTDSRFKEISFIPRENIVGRPSLIFFSIKDNFYKLLLFNNIFRDNRFFKKINNLNINEKI